MLVIFTVHLLQNCIFLSACFQNMKTVDFLSRSTWVLDPYDIVQEFAHAVSSLSTIIILVTNTCKTEFSPTLCSHKKTMWIDTTILARQGETRMKNSLEATKMYYKSIKIITDF